MEIKLGQLCRDKITGYTGIATERLDTIGGFSKITLELADDAHWQSLAIEEDRLEVVEAKEADIAEPEEPDPSDENEYEVSRKFVTWLLERFGRDKLACLSGDCEHIRKDDCITHILSCWNSEVLGADQSPKDEDKDTFVGRVVGWRVDPACRMTESLLRVVVNDKYFRDGRVPFNSYVRAVKIPKAEEDGE